MSYLGKQLNELTDADMAEWEQDYLDKRSGVWDD